MPSVKVLLQINSKLHFTHHNQSLLLSYACTYIRARVCAYTYTHIHTHAHSHTGWQCVAPSFKSYMALKPKTQSPTLRKPSFQGTFGEYLSSKDTSPIELILLFILFLYILYYKERKKENIYINIYTKERKKERLKIYSFTIIKITHQAAPNAATFCQ